MRPSESEEVSDQPKAKANEDSAKDTIEWLSRQVLDGLKSLKRNRSSVEKTPRVEGDSARNPQEEHTTSSERDETPLKKQKTSSENQDRREADLETRMRVLETEKQAQRQFIDKLEKKIDEISDAILDGVKRNNQIMEAMLLNQQQMTTSMMNFMRDVHTLLYPRYTVYQPVPPPPVAPAPVPNFHYYRPPQQIPQEQVVHHVPPPPQHPQHPQQQQQQQTQPQQHPQQLQQQQTQPQQHLPQHPQQLQQQQTQPQQHLPQHPQQLQQQQTQPQQHLPQHPQQLQQQQTQPQQHPPQAPQPAQKQPILRVQKQPALKVQKQPALRIRPQVVPPQQAAPEVQQQQALPNIAQRATSEATSVAQQQTPAQGGQRGTLEVQQQTSPQAKQVLPLLQPKVE